MSNYPLISIITATYNGAKYLPILFESIKKQSYPNLEHIIVNDGSTDDTDAIVSKYVKEAKELEEKKLNIIYIKQTNQGLGGATQTALKAVNGKYFTWINDDDIFLKDFVMNRYLLISRNPDVGIVYGDGYVSSNIVRQDSFSIKGKFSDLKTKWNIKTPQTKINLEKEFIKCFLVKKSLFNYGAFLIDTRKFDDCTNDRFIYPSRYCQEMQIILPVSHKYKALFSDCCDFVFLQRGDSLGSLSSINLEKERRKYADFEHMFKLFYESIGKRKKGIRIAKQIYSINVFFGAYYNNNYDLAIKTFKELPFSSKLRFDIFSRFIVCLMRKN